MKKFLALLMAVIFVFSLTACDPVENTDTNDGASNSKFGLGIYVEAITPTDAEDEETNGKAGFEATFATVLVAEDGKIIACKLDATSNEATYTVGGAAVKTEYQTKRELGDNYGMVAWAGATAEWYAQADAFEKLVVGKTLDEVKALEASGGKGTDAVISAGCTITVSEFVKAIEKAYNNAALVEGAASGTLGLGVVSTQSKALDAEGEDDGTIEITVSVSASVIGADGKVIKTVSDGISEKFTFTKDGKATTDTKAIQTKREQGADYGMVAWGGAKLEWYAQADAFDAICAGKTKSELEAYVAGDKSDLISAGCTIDVTDMSKAAIKSIG